MGFVSRALSAIGLAPVTKEADPVYLPVTGGWLSSEAAGSMNWWQMGHDVRSGGRSAMVEACVASYAQTVAMCPGNHWRWNKAAGRERVTTSALCRILRYPNDYQSISDFLLNATRDLLLEGNAYALVLRNDRFEPVALHRMDPLKCSPILSVTGDVFYRLGGNEIIERRLGVNLVVPARDVLHLRLHTPRHPLLGETPLAAAALQIAAGNAALVEQVRFFLNQSRPSFVLGTEKDLTPEQAQALRKSWNEQAAGMNKGGTPILSSGLKPLPIGASAKDSELADILKLSDQAIANVYRTPLQVLGIADKAPFASTEALMQAWRAGGLGFVLNHIEEAVGLLFKLGGQPEEYVEFDTSALMRSAFKDRVAGWAEGVRAGIFDRNAARAEFEMSRVEHGDEPWVQQQDVPLSVAAELAKQPAVPPEPASAEETDPEQERALLALFEKDMREALRA